MFTRLTVQMCALFYAIIISTPTTTMAEIANTVDPDKAAHNDKDIGSNCS